jgi:hypothetical protein
MRPDAWRTKAAQVASTSHGHAAPTREALVDARTPRGRPKPRGQAGPHPCQSLRQQQTLPRAKGSRRCAGSSSYIPVCHISMAESKAYCPRYWSPPPARMGLMRATADSRTEATRKAATKTRRGDGTPSATNDVSLHAPSPTSVRIVASILRGTRHDDIPTIAALWRRCCCRGSCWSQRTAPRVWGGHSASSEAGRRQRQPRARRTAHWRSDHPGRRLDRAARVFYFWTGVRVRDARKTPHAGPADDVQRKPPACAGGSCSYSRVPLTG